MCKLPTHFDKIKPEHRKIHISFMDEDEVTKENGGVVDNIEIVLKNATCVSGHTRKMNYGIGMLFTVFYFIPAITIISCYLLIFMKLRHVNNNLNRYEQELQEKNQDRLKLTEPVISALKSSGIDPEQATIVQYNSRREKSLQVKINIKSQK